MKKFISLLAAMALSLASVTAFAAEATETDIINVTFTADKATIAPGESVTISAFISANDNADVSFDTQAMFGLIFDQDNFTYDVTYEGIMAVEDYSGDYGLLWASVENDSSFVANEACIQVKFTANADATEKTYAFDVSEDPIDTGFAHGLFLYDPDEGNVKLTGTTVEVKAGGNDDKVTTEDTLTDGEGVVEFDYAADYVGNKAFEGKKVIFQNVETTRGNIKADTKVKVTRKSTNEVKYFGEKLYANWGVEGEGELAAKTIAFGLVIDATLDAADFEFVIE